MSTTKHPVGPQASSVYRRRRLVVGLGVLAVLAIILLIFFRPGGGDDQAVAPSPAATADPAAAADPAAPAGGDPATTACDPATVQVEAITDQGSYDPDDDPELSLSVTNTGTTPCDLNAGTSTQVFTITSGADVYWTSTDCQSDPADATVTLEPNVAVSTKTPLTWDRTRSSPETCEITDREAVPAEGASYYLTVSVGGVESASPTQFLLN
ncbi:hypothetical protein E3T61_18540 [Cryobacterium lactosi]|uniref:DUF4232 domain-containing protein n=1 Tax=Cryobacterium lactosi TaxID=1259202 RepID=A0A4R9BK70_9MICO|nr:hypothetical protein [Cryobacterium lactosi]TFD85017.1 hypothetical protein E3T61_18540 [Cryobacterium lactosi]